MQQVFDFHLHTKNSDGEFTTEELINQLKEQGIKYFSITDHDDINSIKEVANCDLGDMYYIPGIEISSILDGKYKMHILGYGINPDNEDLKAIVDNLKRARSTRFYELAQMLDEQYNIKIPNEELDDVIENNNTPSKAHLARLMVKHNYVSSVSEAFTSYLDGLKAKTPNRIEASLAINIIKNAGGKVFWAHPKKVEKEYGISFEELMPRLKELGLDGIEVYNSLHSLEDSKRYEEFAKKNNLLISGGSDYHGINTKQDVKIGVIYNSGEDEKIDINNISLIKGDKNMDEFNKTDENVDGLDDITKLEGVRDFYKSEIYGDVFNYIRKNRLLDDPEDTVCKNAFDLIDMADALPVIYASENISDEEKKRILSEGIERMNNKLSTIKTMINPSDNQKTKGGSNDD